MVLDYLYNFNTKDRHIRYGTVSTGRFWKLSNSMVMVTKAKTRYGFRKARTVKGHIEVDETYLYSGEKQGRSLIGNKTLVVAAVEKYKD